MFSVRWILVVPYQDAFHIKRQSARFKKTDAGQYVYIYIWGAKILPYFFISYHPF
jgi:hypothetical protein